MQKIILAFIASFMLFNSCIAANIEIPPVKPLQSPVEKYPALKNTIADYMNAWQKQDLKTMRGYENWEGGDELNEIGYIKAFNTDLNISKWQITKVEELANNEYKILVLITHNPPAKIAPLVKKGLTVNSTLIQWWKKQDDKFVHLFHVERKRIKEMMSPSQE
ncbi:MAG: hypothetical protein KAG43_10440 [Candidatus Marithrix sp.]|nr:hypothetical protein [Candidatus Marithrix sp.]